MRGAHVQRVLVTHFEVPAVEMLFDEPLCCPIYGALTFDGLAADSQGRFHLWSERWLRGRIWVLKLQPLPGALISW